MMWEAPQDRNQFQGGRRQFEAGKSLSNNIRAAGRTAGRNLGVPAFLNTGWRIRAGHSPRSLLKTEPG